MDHRHLRGYAADEGVRDFNDHSIRSHRFHVVQLPAGQFIDHGRPNGSVLRSSGMDLRNHITLTRLLTVLLSVIAPMTRAVAQNSGKVAAVNQDATGTPPGASSHTLVVGSGVVYKENIKTSAQGSTQILFPDQSTLNVGRSSSIVIDEYVYDPKTGTGTMLASINKGTLRFV